MKPLVSRSPLPLKAEGFLFMKKGCVYFVKHNGMSPIKIGMTSSEAPSNRLESMNTYSPYRIEVIGVIRTESPLKLEQKIHKMLKEHRLNGEWFDISIDKCNQLIYWFTNSTPKYDYIEMYYDDLLECIDVNRRILFSELRILINNFNSNNDTNIKLRKFNKHVKKNHKNVEYGHTNSNRWLIIE